MDRVACVCEEVILTHIPHSCLESNHMSTDGCTKNCVFSQIAIKMTKRLMYGMLFGFPLKKYLQHMCC